MNKVSATAVAVVLLAVPQGAQAQNWSGSYIGFSAGAARGASTASTNVLDVNSPTSWFQPTDPTLVNPALSGPSSGTQFIGGIQAGHNWQSGSVVYGVEVDFSALNLAMKRSGYGDFGNWPFAAATSASTDWMLSSRGRLGFAAGSVLFYGTAGLAATDLKIAANYSDLDGATGASGSGAWTSRKLSLGWTAGGGLEWALDARWSLKTEYLFTQFKDIEANGTVRDGQGQGYSNGVTTKADLSAHVARAGLNYKF